MQSNSMEGFLSRMQVSLRDARIPKAGEGWKSSLQSSCRSSGWYIVVSVRMQEMKSQVTLFELLNKLSHRELERCTSYAESLSSSCWLHDPFLVGLESHHAPYQRCVHGLPHLPCIARLASGKYPPPLCPCWNCSPWWSIALMALEFTGVKQKQNEKVVFSSKLNIPAK